VRECVFCVCVGVVFVYVRVCAYVFVVHVCL